MIPQILWLVDDMSAITAIITSYLNYVFIDVEHHTAKLFIYVHSAAVKTNLYLNLHLNTF